MSPETAEDWTPDGDPQLREIVIETVQGYSDGSETLVFFGDGAAGAEDYVEADPEIVVERSEMR